MGYQILGWSLNNEKCLVPRWQFLPHDHRYFSAPSIMKSKFPRHLGIIARAFRPRLAFLAAGASALTFVMIIFFLTRSPPHRPTSTFPLAPSPSKREDLYNQSSKWIEGSKPLSSDTFIKVMPPTIPNLNSSEVVQIIIKDIDGRWTDGTTTLTIDAKRLRARLASGSDALTQDMIVRDVSGLMMVIDIGPRRLFLLRRPDTLAVGSGALANPAELRRD
ncbi:hypothetical protein [Methylobacterium iners]|uniref:hypothetical protein n=1 Tax=Methylobacterium iners TaxID=418707 RepID=UPI001EE38ABA|nr:hypothetical protein [Methylobacterium iners]